MEDDGQNKDQIIALQREEIRLLKEKIDYLIKVIHGSKSEKLDAAQLELLLDPEGAKKPGAVDGNEEPPAAEDFVSSSKRKRAPRKPRLPENIPTEHTVLIPDEVTANPGAYRQVGEKRSEKLDVTPTRFVRKITIRPNFIKKGELVPRWLTAPAPPSLLEGSILTPSLLAHILTAKYCDHLPFYRQEQIMARRHGVRITRHTLCHWANFGAQELEPLYKLIAADLRASPAINIDETPVNYLGSKNGGTAQGYFWVYRSLHAGVLYDWHTGRAHTCLDRILTSDGKSFSGLIQSDGFSAYQTWSDKHPDVQLAGCWAHARRKFNDALPHSKEAAVVLQMIQHIYHEEHRFKRSLQEAGRPPDAIIHLRRRYLRAHLKKIRITLHGLRPKYLPKSKMGTALTYAINQWCKLSNAIKRCVSIDNNACENAVRPLKLGAKNWLFIGREDTGWRSAVIYTLIENIRTHGKDPYAYLEWVFGELIGKTNQDDLRQLLPQAWLGRLETPASIVGGLKATA